jgi:protein involved in polysaccharide export with SLBB domain
MRPSPLRSLASVAVVVLGWGAHLTAQVPDDTVQVGDRVLLRVEGEPQLSDTFTVSPGPALVLPALGELALKDVRRAQVEPYLARELARFLKQPLVHARVLVRLAVLGEVERPGFYAVPADAILTEALMTAGGPTRDAKVSQLRIERDHAPVWSGEALQQSITRGLTVDQMKLRSGDRIVVPRRHNAAATAQVLGVLLTIPAAIYGVTRLR